MVMRVHHYGSMGLGHLFVNKNAAFDLAGASIIIKKLRARTRSAATIVDNMVSAATRLQAARAHKRKTSPAAISLCNPYIQPITFPTVARGTERLSITPSPFHGDASTSGSSTG